MKQRGPGMTPAIQEPAERAAGKPARALRAGASARLRGAAHADPDRLRQLRGRHRRQRQHVLRARPALNDLAATLKKP